MLHVSLYIGYRAHDMDKINEYKQVIRFVETFPLLALGKDTMFFCRVIIYSLFSKQLYFFILYSSVCRIGIFVINCQCDTFMIILYSDRVLDLLTMPLFKYFCFLLLCLQFIKWSNNIFTKMLRKQMVLYP